MCICIFCDESIDNVAASVYLSGDRMHQDCYAEYMNELAYLDAHDDDTDPSGGYVEDEREAYQYDDDYAYDWNNGQYDDDPSPYSGDYSEM